MTRLINIIFVGLAVWILLWREGLKTIAVWVQQDGYPTKPLIVFLLPYLNRDLDPLTYLSRNLGTVKRGFEEIELFWRESPYFEGVWAFGACGRAAGKKHHASQNEQRRQKFFHD